MKKQPKKRWQGLNPHRYKNNPLEGKLALAWEALNEQGSDQRSVVDCLMDVTGKGTIRATDHERLIANTLIQWLGSPVGFAWICDTLGLEIMRYLRDHTATGEGSVRPGQVYQSLDKRDKGRKVLVKRLRYDVDSRLYTRGPSAQWACCSLSTGRMTYLRESRLLDGALWQKTSEPE